VLAEHRSLAQLRFEEHRIAGVEAWVARCIPAARAAELWREASTLALPLGVATVLTDDDYVHPHIEPIDPFARISIDEARAARERCVRASSVHAGVLDQILRATPLLQPYEERDFFSLSPMCERVSLALLACSSTEAVLSLTGIGEGDRPTEAELAAFLEHFAHQCETEPLYTSCDVLELIVGRPPHELDELRTVARDVFLLSQGNADGYGVESPARLMRRLMSDRWCIWWYGT